MTYERLFKQIQAKRSFLCVGLDPDIMSFSPEIICAEIRKHIPSLEMVYEIDPVKDAISEGWPNLMDDSVARAEWDWAPKWGLSEMTTDMLEVLGKRLGK